MLYYEGDLTEILFYHLEHKPIDQVLPDLLEKCLSRGWKSYIQCHDKTNAQKLDKHLWHYRDDSFLPHAMDPAPAALTKNITPEAYAKLQPILVGYGADNANQANIRFLLEGADIETDAIKDYQRIIIMFDAANENNVAAARVQWKKFKNLGRDIISEQTYWQQDYSGKWEKKA